MEAENGLAYIPKWREYTLSQWGGSEATYHQENRELSSIGSSWLCPKARIDRSIKVKVKEPRKISHPAGRRAVQARRQSRQKACQRKEGSLCSTPAHARLEIWYFYGGQEILIEAETMKPLKQTNMAVTGIISGAILNIGCVV